MFIHHPNTLVIYRFVCLFTVLIPLHNIFLYAFELFRLSLRTTDPCQRLWWTPLLVYIRSATAVFALGFSSALIILCIERFICICRIYNYEDTQKPHLVATFLVFMTTAFSVGFYYLYTSSVDWSRGLAITTVRSADNGYILQIVTIYQTTSEMLGALFFLFIRLWSLRFRKRIRNFALDKKKNVSSLPANFALTVKYQIEETLRMTGVFLPIVVSQCLLRVLQTTSSTIVNMKWPSPGVIIQMIILESYTVLVIQPLITGLLLMRGSHQLDFFCSKANQVDAVVSVNENQDDYFGRLKNMFENGAPKTKN
ncbi:serpentine type 7TM GPCR receptor class ab chemoreceptor domain-containing protein [Ditylenchus destructor]|nr:serpentine type 7TM GPCR receptor class ab chemoreceptor domain-containing protein [Ditylenchus destructor]